MKVKNFFYVGDFESLNETSEQHLIGGFSSSFTVEGNSAANLNEVGSNNCDGGNCVSGCGSGQNVICPNAHFSCGSGG